MGLNSEFSRAVILDIETAPMQGVEAFTEPGEPPANYKNADAIERWQADYKAQQIAKAAIDPDLCRIVAWGLADRDEVVCQVTRNEGDERQGLQTLWGICRETRLLGYNILSFDLPVLLRRSLYLHVQAPSLQLDKYRHPQITDLLMVLSNNGAQKLRSLKFYCKRFGLPVPEGDGADVPGLVAAGDWTAIERHLRGDLEATAALAARLGVWSAQPVSA